jgi:hypothetical protein
MTQRQVLRACGRANRIGLQKPQSIEGSFECGRREQAPDDRKSTQVGECERHLL